jgi:transposase-like protein
MSERMVPYYCPYCGDENLFPHGETHGQWECRACRRAFAVKFIGLLSHEKLGSDHASRN